MSEPPAPLARPATAGGSAGLNCLTGAGPYESHARPTPRTLSARAPLHAAAGGVMTRHDDLNVAS